MAPDLGPSAFVLLAVGFLVRTLSKVDIYIYIGIPDWWSILKTSGLDCRISGKRSLLPTSSESRIPASPSSAMPIVGSNGLLRGLWPMYLIEAVE